MKFSQLIFGVLSTAPSLIAAVYSREDYAKGSLYPQDHVDELANVHVARDFNLLVAHETLEDELDILTLRYYNAIRPYIRSLTAAPHINSKSDPLTTHLHRRRGVSGNSVIPPMAITVAIDPPESLPDWLKANVPNPMTRRNVEISVRATVENLKLAVAKRYGFAVLAPGKTIKNDLSLAVNGRMMQNGSRVSSYDITDGSVIKLVIE